MCMAQVQENCIDLVGRIADRGAEYVPAREWMRICFELLEMLKAHKKGIRRATVNTFGYIAKAIGPQVCLDILVSHISLDIQYLQTPLATLPGPLGPRCADYEVVDVTDGGHSQGHHGLTWSPCKCKVGFCFCTCTGDFDALAVFECGHEEALKGCSWHAGCAGDAAEQPQGPGAPEQGVHHRGHRHCGRDLLPLHCPPSAHERVQGQPP